MLRFRVVGDQYWRVASYGSIPGATCEEVRPIDRASIPGRAMVDRETIHIHDFWQRSRDGFPEAVLAPDVRCPHRSGYTVAA